MNRPTDNPDPIAIYRQTVGEVYAFIARRCGGAKQTAEDLTQETYLRFIAECKRGKTPRTPAAWLRTVAHNLLMSHYRRARPTAADPAVMDAALEAPEGGLRDETLVGRVMWGIAGLKESWASMLAAFHVDGRSVASIALDMGISERAVEGQLRRARIALRKRLEQAQTEDSQ